MFVVFIHVGAILLRIGCGWVETAMRCYGLQVYLSDGIIRHRIYYKAYGTRPIFVGRYCRSIISADIGRQKIRRVT